jgi:hypothetical protein
VYDLTVMVIDRDDLIRAALVGALRKLGLRALGVVVPDEAVRLLDGLHADVVLVRGDGSSPAVEALREKVPIVRVAADATVEDAVIALLRAMGRPEEAASLN